MQAGIQGLGVPANEICLWCRILARIARAIHHTMSALHDNDGKRMLLSLTRRRQTLLLAGVIAASAAVSWYVVPSLWAAPLTMIDRVVSGMHRHIAIVDEQPMAYIRGGKGPTLLLLHGFGGNKEQWHAVARQLTADFDVVAPDLAGFGESPVAPDASYTIAAQAHTVRRFMATVGIQHAHIVGSSMGGQIGAQLAAAYPDLARSLVMLEPHGVQTAAKTRFDEQIARGAIPLVARNQHEFAAIVDLVFVERPFIPFPVYHALEAEAIRRHDANLAIWKAVRSEADTLPRLLSEVRCPTLALWGDSEKVFHTSAIARLRQANPMLASMIMRRTGHLPMMEHPEQVVEAIRNFQTQNGADGFE